MVPGAGVYGQNYPSKAIRIVTVNVGGGGDFASRLIAQPLAVNLGQPVIVENRPSGSIPGEVVAKAPPDGYTLLLQGVSHWLLPFFQDNLPWDPVKDFAPITMVATAPLVLVIHPSLPAKSVKELTVLAKTRPGQINYATSGSGSSSHLSAELFRAMTGSDMVRINYKGVVAALTAVGTGEIQLTFAASATLAPFIKSGRLKALAVTSARPSALFPGLPTVAATLPGYESVSSNGIFAPANTPAAIIGRLNQEILRVVNMADVKERFLNVGAEIVGGSPEQFAAAMKSDMTRLGKVIKDAGIRAD